MLVLAVAALIAVMMATSALPAMAQVGEGVLSGLPVDDLTGGAGGLTGGIPVVGSLLGGS